MRSNCYSPHHTCRYCHRLAMAIYSTGRYIQRRPPNPFLGTTSFNRETHGGRLGHELSLFIIHHVSLFNGMDGCDNFLELGCNDGTFTILCHGSVALIRPHVFNSYMIELDHCRYLLSVVFLNHCRCILPLNICSIHGSFSDEWTFLPLPQIMNLYLNNYHVCVQGTTTVQLCDRIDHHCLVGSTLICFNTFFSNNSNWREERFIVTKLPRGQISWCCLPRSSINSNVNQCITLPIFKYTKMSQPHTHPKSLRNTKPTVISFQEFWRQNRVVR